MSTVNERILDRVRMDLGDLPQPFNFSFAGDGIRDHFYLEHRPINPQGMSILRNEMVVVDPAFQGISIDYTAGMMVYQTAPPPGEIWEVEGWKWRYFSDEDLQIFIDTSYAQHTYNRGDASGGDYTSADIKPVEEYPISLYATIQALWALATDAAFDIDILSPDGVNIPRSERYRQLLDMIGARQQQYEEIAKALNIGIAAIEVFTARRTAKLTNRLVPVYLPQEFDDGSKPKRVLFPPMLQGTQPVESGIATHDVDLITGDAKSFILDFAFDLTGCEIKNAIRRTLPGTRTGTVGPPIHEWTQEIIDAPNGKVRLSLTGKQTRSLPYNCYWEIQVKKPTEAESRTKLRGMIRATNNEVVV
jgi:hypothetical protein